LSISKVHDLIQNKGCVWTVSILMILSMVIGGFMCNDPRYSGADGRLNPGEVVAKIGEYEITERLIQNEIERGGAMYGGLDNLPPNFRLQIQAGVLRSTVLNIAQLEMAKKFGIEPTDQDVENLVNSQIDQEVQQMKQQYIMQQKLKPDATEAEFAALFKKEQGQDISDLKKRAIEYNRELLEGGSDLRIPVAALAVGQPLLEAIKKTTNLTDDELKKTYDTFEFKRLTLTKGDAAEKAKKVIAEVKGGLAFEKAIDRYNEDTVDPKQKASEKIEPLGRVAIRGFEAYRPLENLKPGEMSDPITIGTTVNIFKLIRVKNELPKDFAQKKDTYRDTQLNSLAASKLQNDLMEAQKSVKIDWTSQVYKLLYDYGRVAAENLPSDERTKLEKQILDESIRLSTEGESHETRLASTIALVSLQNMMATASPAEKSKLQEQQIKVYEAYLNDSEDTAMRLELVEIYRTTKNADGFATQLEAAANGNLGNMTPAGQGAFSQINKFLKEGKDAKLLTTEQAKLIEEVQQQWVQQKAEQDKYEAEAKKAEAEAQKQAEADAKKAQAEAAKKTKTREQLEKEKAASGGKK
jgi:hypothetical protein